jgi:hypothetical protein
VNLAPNPLLQQSKDVVADPLLIRNSVVKTTIKKRNIADLRKGSAAVAMESLERDGMELFGLTRGQFSLSDMIGAILKKTGPAALQVSTWTAANASVVEMGELLDSGLVLSCRWLVDQTFVRRAPSLAQQIREKFGADAIRITKTHAKFVTIIN